VKDGQDAWREDLDPKLEVVRKLAVEYGAILVPTDVELTKQAASVGPEMLAGDGVHPSPAGHRALADLWRRYVLDN
jgi:acyl-CoA thioesterase-1